jgi:hypothetical protein
MLNEKAQCVSVLNDKVKAKILGLRLTNESLLAMFEEIAADVKIREIPSGTLIVPLYEDGDLKPGDFAPELFFVIRRVEQ